ncbi:MAG: alpha/beta hydrolase [Actinomycetota bacterium]
MHLRSPLSRLVTGCAFAISAVGCSSSVGVTRGTSAPIVTATNTTLAGTTGNSTTSTTSNSTTSNSTTSTSDVHVGTITWSPSTDNPRIETGHLQVPVDYQDPSKGTFDLYLARHLAKPERRIGSLLVNPGGPGFGGTDLAMQAEGVYSTTLTDQFDIVAWDPRGTGLSTPAIDCVSDYDHFFNTTDITPDTPAEHQQLVDLAKEFADACVKKNPEMAYTGTNNSARDMDSIRASLGEPKISYFGFSYGSELGATWATLFPNTVRAAVLDGAVDPTANLLDSNLQQSAGFEHSLNTFLSKCSADTSCKFHNGGDAGAAFDRLMLQLDDQPMPADPNRPPVTRAVALNAAGEAMYTDALWPQLAQALDDAQHGNAKGLLALSDEYFRRNANGTWDNSLEAFQVITCEDTTERSTVAQDDADAAKFHAIAPRFSPGTTGSYFCTFFPAPKDPRVTITGNGAGPIVVVGTTGDPATPLAGSKRMADTLENGHLVVVDLNQHTGYDIGTCAGNAVDQYLVDPKGHVPENGTHCR